MQTKVRIALVLLALAFAAMAAWFAWFAVLNNRAMLRSWTRTEGRVSGLGDNYVEVEIGTGPDMRRVAIWPDHQLGLSLSRKAPILVDPADPAHARAGGLLQLWLMPATQALLAGLLLACARAAVRVGCTGGGTGYGAGHWMLSAPPPPLPTELRVHRPAREWKAPLGWSLMGVLLAACEVFGTADAPIIRLLEGSLGGLFALFAWALSLQNRTIEVAADAHGVRETSAFGWRDLRWEEVASVEVREVAPAYHRALHLGSELPFPGRTTRSLVFAGPSGRALMRLSVAMQPSDTMRRLMDFCTARTGLREQFRHIEVPDI
jgi:hypothetical protein